MGYWNFLSILQTLDLQNKRKRGEQVVHEEVPQSNKDMIQRLKDLHE